MSGDGAPATADGSLATANHGDGAGSDGAGSVGADDESRPDGRPSNRPPSSKSLRQRFHSAAAAFPFTLPGLLIAAACVLSCFYFGFGKIDLILLGVGAIGLVLVGLSLVLTIVAALITRRRVRQLPTGKPLSLECGYWVPTGFSLPSLWYIPFISVQWKWTEPKGRVRCKTERGRVHEEVFPERRGHTHLVTRHFEIGDIFGLCKLSFFSQQSAEVRFLPWMGALRHMHVLRGMAAGDEISHPDGPPEGDRYDMRHYVPGDPIRFVLWKVFAKSRQLVIRTPERAISRARQTSVYLVAHEGDEPAAGAARLAIDFGAFGGDWVFGADGSSQVAKTKADAMALLAQSAHITADEGGAGLSHFLQTASGKMGRAIVFVPSKPGPWLARVRTAARSGSGQVQFIIGIDGLDVSPGGNRLARWAVDEQRRDDDTPFANASATDLRAIIDQLGNQVLVVDRMLGQTWTIGQLAAALPPSKPPARVA